MPTNSKTRKNLFGNDPFMRNMMSGKIKWGDLLTNAPAAAVSKKNSTRKNKRNSPSWASGTNELENWNVPNMTKSIKLADIFPVELEPISENTFAVVWNEKKLKEWSETRSKSYDEWMEYKAFAEYRLLHTLRAFPRLYSIHAPRNEKELAVIKLLGAPMRVSPKYTGPVLRKLTNVKEHFPVVWNKVEGRKDESTYAIDLRGDWKRGKSKIDVARKEAELLAALGASKFWQVLPAVGSETARVEMRHD